MPEPVTITKRYSGDASHDFWSLVNGLPEPYRDAAYSLGVVLQNVEDDVIRLILNVARDAADLGGKR